MALLTVQTAKRSSNGIDLAGVSAAGGGDTFVNNGKEVLVIKNGSGGAITLTVVTTATVDGMAVADLTASIGAGETRMVGPFDPAIYNDTKAAGGVVSLTYSGVTSLTVAPVSVIPVN